MVEKRTVGIILAMILVVVVAAYFISKLLDLQPEKDIFPRGKEMLVRYYACSLAICTHGCDWLETNKICLDNDTFTRECNLWCHDVCVNRFNNDCNDAGDCCGPPWNLTVSLVGRVQLKGCYEKIKGGTGGSYYICYNTETEDVLYKLNQKEGFTEAGDLIGCRPTFCIGPGEHYYLGLIYDEGSKKRGVGGIYLDPIESREKFGCIDDPVPIPGAFPPRVEDAPGFYQCRFQGMINMWSDWQDDDCADIRFNSTINGDWKFEIECTEPFDEHDYCYQKINLGETADYMIVIDNQLGSGKKFILHWSDNHGGHSDNHLGANCTFWKDDPSEEIDRIFVGNGETEEFYMSCTPTDTGTYSIWIDAWPRIGYMGKQTQVELVTSDFSWEVTPTDKQRIRGDESKKYTVRIDNEMGADTDFVLSLNVPGGLTCKFDENDDITYNLPITDDDLNSTTFTCSGDPGKEYEITINVDAGGMKDDSKTRVLAIVVCEGAIVLKLDQYSVEFNGEFEAIVSGLEGCDGELVEFAINDTIIEYVPVDKTGDNAGKGCRKTFSVDDLDTYPLGSNIVYTMIELTGDIPPDYNDVGEKAQADLKIYVTGPVGSWFERWDLDDPSQGEHADYVEEDYIWRFGPFGYVGCEGDPEDPSTYISCFCRDSDEKNVFDDYCYNAVQDWPCPLPWSCLHWNGYCYGKMCFSEVNDSTYRPIGGCMDIKQEDRKTQETCINAWGVGSCSGDPSSCSCSEGTYRTIYDGYITSMGDDLGYGYLRICTSSGSGKKVVGTCTEVWSPEGHVSNNCKAFGQAYCVEEYNLCRCTLGKNTTVMGGTGRPDAVGDVLSYDRWRGLQGWGRLYFCVMD